MVEPALSSESSQPRLDRVPLAIIVPIEPPVRARSEHAPLGSLALPALGPRSYGPPAKTYVVPKRFGVSGIFGLITGMALLFGFLRFFEAPPIVFLFLGSMALVVTIVQMFYGQVPRQASMAAGAVLWPIFVVSAAVMEGARPGTIPCLAVMGALLGAPVGYIVGTCVAGIFLVMERIDPYLPGGRARALKHDPAAAAAPGK